MRFLFTCPPPVEAFIPAPQDMRHINAELGLVKDDIHAIRWRDGSIVMVEFTEASMNGHNVELIVEIGEQLWDRYGIHYSFVVEG